jgi:hypothetical protein
MFKIINPKQIATKESVNFGIPTVLNFVFLDFEFV